MTRDNLPETPYGNYRDFDNPVHWSDDYEIEPQARRVCDDLYSEFLKDCADVCGLDTHEWDTTDWEIFEEILEA